MIPGNWEIQSLDGHHLTTRFVRRLLDAERRDTIDLKKCYLLAIAVRRQDGFIRDRYQDRYNGRAKR